MSTGTANSAVDTYMRQLRKAARSLPRDSREELTEEISAHLASALEQGATEAKTQSELHRLGDPQQIVAEARERLGIASSSVTRSDWLAVGLLLIGGFLVVVGWFVGVVLLWSSRVWTVRDKVIGTLIVPGGLAASLFVTIDVVAHESSSSSCTSGVGRLVVGGARQVTGRCTGGSSGLHGGPLALLLACLIAAPIITSIYLARRLRRAGDGGAAHIGDTARLW